MLDAFRRNPAQFGSYGGQNSSGVNNSAIFPVNQAKINAGTQAPVLSATSIEQVSNTIALGDASYNNGQLNNVRRDTSAKSLD